MPDQNAALLQIMMDVDAAHEADFNRWYWEEHLPHRMELPGFLRARRYVAADGGPKYLALFEIENAAVLNSDGYLALRANPTPWTERLRPHYRVRRNVYTELIKPD